MDMRVILLLALWRLPVQLNIVLIRLVGHSSHISQPLDLCVFSLLNLPNQREQESKRLKREILKIYRAILAFYKAMIIPMARGSFIRAGFHLDQDNIFAPLRVTADEVLNRIAIPEMGLDELVFPHAGEDSRATGAEICRRARIPGPTDFAISLRAYVNEVTGTCPVCGHTKVEDESEEEQNDEICHLSNLEPTFLRNSDDILRGSFSIQLLFN
jgi:hypothetical protein